MLPLPNLTFNSLLARLSPDDYDLLQPSLMTVNLPTRYALGTADVPLEFAYFVTSGIASVVTKDAVDPPIEVGVIGFEGMANLPLVMGCDRSPNDTFMQVAGSAERISADALRAAMASSQTLHTTLLKYVHAFMAQNASTILANGHARIAQRLSRWLLMADNRIEGDELPLTHEFLSIMLGTRRSSVSTALSELESKGVLRKARGSVILIDRVKLMEIANGYYGVAEREYARVFM